MSNMVTRKRPPPEPAQNHFMCCSFWDWRPGGSFELMNGTLVVPPDIH